MRQRERSVRQRERLLRQREQLVEAELNRLGSIAE